MPDYENAFMSVHKVTGISRTEILSPSRKGPVAEARQLLVLLLSRDGNTDQKIAWTIGRSQPNVNSIRRNAEAYLELSSTFRKKLDRITWLYGFNKK